MRLSFKQTLANREMKEYADANKNPYDQVKLMLDSFISLYLTSCSFSFASKY